MSADLAVALRRLEQEGRTGVLRAGDGEFHLADGVIASAHCRRATGLDRLVVAAGVATPEDWQRAGAGDPSRVLAQPQLETLALLSVYDAAYFLLASTAEPEFRPAPPHWLAGVCHVRPRELVRECARRGDPESGPWPAELVDRVPVVPVRRVHRRRVVLTAGQVEVLAAADARRSITDIARDLGRTTYGCLAAVRELTAAGLLEAPGARSETASADAGPELRPGGQVSGEQSPGRGTERSTGRHSIDRVRTNPGSSRATALSPVAAERAAEETVRNAVAAAMEAARHAPPRVRLPGGDSRRARTAPDTAADSPIGPKSAPPPPLRRRVRQPVPAPGPDRWEPVDVNVLVRVRAALEELA
ncbi:MULTISPECIES: hypothetical protein [Nocardia]|uniref:hypothetical protein n=1 Tax=Nocardia TaxID=1817 RepID=UPI000BEF518B|nr:MULTISPECIES: hypothetical protein [Nocardia]MBF6187708.1 hypothetical protein [Nocardia farcinica]MBF6313156.1 hypothetical protein [Nocardia farcinica]MBF6409523.1 hypothetical protein [Nocardia farcinica]PEH77519.1 hypothetical protein CRM89_17290 [Nocardia sp. FDAARGOS_372]UEX22052.1 hypothetical protein LMJ57_24245 [Nocardia farcinica]